MARGRRDTETLDLLSWRPAEEMVRRYKPERVRAASLRILIAHAVAETLRDSTLNRFAVAERMSAYLGEAVSKNMLDAYASASREEHSISYLRLLALVHATGDVRPLQIGAELLGHSVIDDRYLSWVEVGQLGEAKEEITKNYDAALRTARRNTGR